MDKIKTIIHSSGGARPPHFQIPIKKGGYGGETRIYLLDEREAAKLVTELMRNLTLIARPRK